MYQWVFFFRFRRKAVTGSLDGRGLAGLEVALGALYNLFNNAGYYFRFFNDMNEALKWLLDGGTHGE